MATFAKLVLESIEDNYHQTGEDNYHHTGTVTKYDHKNKIIYVNPDKSHVKTTARKYAKYGAAIGFLTGGRSKFGDELKNQFGDKLSNKFTDKLNGRFGSSLATAGIFNGVGALIGLHRQNKEKRKIHRLLNAGYKIQYDE